MQNNNSIFTKSQYVFLDTVLAKNYIHLDRVSIKYQSLKDAISEPLKMVFLYGKPGTGKSMLLHKLREDILEEGKNITLYETPIMQENEFYNKIIKDIYKQKEIENITFTNFIEFIEKNKMENMPIVLLDEAQMYSEDFLEKIRLISDTGLMKFILALHKTQKEHVTTKSHFTTRVWKTIELQNATKSELKIYIQKKLMQENCFETANMFHTNSINLIYKITKGNYRDTNKLLYTLFELYTIYLNHENMLSSKISTHTISNKLIEMSAIHTGLINA